MTEVILSDDQAKLVTSAADGVLFRDSSGNLIARIPCRLYEGEEEIIAEAKRRLASDQPRYTFAEVMAHLDMVEKQ
jgi:hypothetical protein